MWHLHQEDGARSNLLSTLRREQLQFSAQETTRQVCPNRTTSTAIARRPSAMSGELPELPIFASSDSFTVETGGRLVN